MTTSHQDSCTLALHLYCLSFNSNNSTSSLLEAKRRREFIFLLCLTSLKEQSYFLQIRFIFPSVLFVPPPEHGAHLRLFLTLEFGYKVARWQETQKVYPIVKKNNFMTWRHSWKQLVNYWSEQKHPAAEWVSALEYGTGCTENIVYSVQNYLLAGQGMYLEMIK